MIECSGRVLMGAGERVTGRLSRIGERGAGRSDAAKILLWDGMKDISEELSAAVGVVIIGDVPRAMSVSEWASCRLPVFRLADGDVTENALADKIAILDCGRQKLCVDPDIDVINSYFGRLAALPESKIPWLCTDSRTVVNGCEGVTVRAEGDEEGVYDFLCDIAERNTGSRIVAEVEYDGGALSRVRGVLRAAVWGRLSLLCRANTPEDAERLLALTHTAFCGLEGEGREFNGFIPKGIKVDTPITLLTRPNRYADFFVIDCNSMLRRFTATENTDVAATEVLGYISQFMRQVGDAKTAIYTHGGISAFVSEYFHGRRQLVEIYTDKATATTLDKWL